MALRKVGVQMVAEDEQQFIRALDQADDKILAFGTAATRAAGQLDKAASSTAAASKAVTAAGAAAETSGQRFAKVESGVNAASSAFGALALPVAAAGVASVKLATDFDQSLRNINSIAGLSEDQLSSLGQQFVDLSLDGTKTFESANALATGFYDIQSSGFAGADGMKVLEASTKAASAGMSTTQTAANAISATLNAYGQSATDASKVSDVLFQVVNLGVVNFEELSSSIGRVIPTAASAHVSIEEVGAAISTMTKSGLAGAQAVTDLNSLISNVIKPSQQASDAAKNMGLDFSFAALQSKGLAGFMHDVMVATHGDAAAMGQLFGSQEALTAALSITKGEMKGFLSDLDGMKNAAGATDRAFQEMSKSTAAQFQRLKANFSALGITVGSELLPRVNDAVKSINDLVKAFTQMPRDEQQRWIDIAVHVGEGTVALYGATKALQGIITVAKTASTAFQGISAAAALLGGAPIVAGVVALGVAVTALGLGAKEAQDHYRGMADAANSANPIIQAAHDAAFGKESGGGGSSWAIDFTHDAESAGKEADNLRTQLKNLLDVQLTQQGLVIALTNAGPAYIGRQQQATAALAETTNQIALLTGRINDYDAAQAQAKASSDALIAAHQQYASSINNTGSALQTMTQAASQGASSIKTVTDAAVLSDKEMASLAKAIETASDAAIGDLQKLTNAESVFHTERENAAAAHEQRLAQIIADAGGPKAAAASTAAQQRIDAENTKYGEEANAAAIAYASQEAAQRQHLGQMLIDLVNSWVAMGKVAPERAAEMTGKLATEYGVQQSLAERTFAAQTVALDRWASNANVSADSVIGDLTDTEKTAASTQRAMDALAKRYVAELIENFKSGKIDADELALAISKVPSRVSSELNTNWGTELEQIRAIGGAMAALPTSKLIRIQAGIDPELAHHSPSPIEQEMTLIDEFTSRQHVFDFGVGGSGLDGIATFSGAMREMPGWVSFIKQASDGMHLLFTPPDTHGMIDALAAVKGTVTDLGALLNGNSTGSSIEGDTKTTFTSIVDLTHQAWEQVRLGISTAVIDARATVDTATKAILTVSTDSFTKLRATSDLAWGQIHKGISDQITLTQAGVKLSTDTMLKGTTDTFQLLQSDSTRIFGQIHLGITNQIAMTRTNVGLSTDAMHKATTATWGVMGADAATGWQKVKANIETPVNAAKDTVTTDSAKMQQDMVIPATLQQQIAASYTSVADEMVKQITRVTQAINDLYNRWRALLDLPRPSAPGGGLPGGGFANPPGRATGGPVFAGMAYTVGERGRELFVPQTSGYVLPSTMTQRISPPASAGQIAHSAIYNTSYGPTFQIQAQYRYQSERSLMQDVRTYQMLHPSV